MLLQPFFEFEDEHDEGGEDYHESDGERITKLPMQFGHEVEVHAIHRGDKSGRKEDDIDDSEYLDNLVLFDIYETEEGILQVVETVETKACIFEQRVDIFDNHCKSWLEVFGEEVALEYIADDALFIHNILPDDGDFFLQVFDLYQYVFVHMVAGLVDVG